jgi:hypothetical protein
MRKRLPLDIGRLQQAYLAAGAVSVFLVLLIGCDGVFDKSAPVLVTTSILYKQVVRGRYGPSYILKVRSWRPGRATEDLAVNAWTYRSTSTERPVVVEVHRGLFGLPWYNRVLAQ